MFIAAMIQLIAACVSFLCMGIRQQDMLSVVLITSFAGVLLYGILALYIRLCRISVFYFLVFILYPITTISMMLAVNDLNQSYGCESFTGTVKNIVYKEDYMMLYMKDNSLNKQGIIVYSYYTDDYSAGIDDEIDVSGEVSMWEKAHNPGNFNSRLYYISCGYPYKCNADRITVIHSGKDSFNAWLYSLKRRFKTVYNTVYDEYDNQLMNSMVLGDKYELEADVKDMYQKSGVSHLLAISGLHISIVGMSVYNMLRKRLNQKISAFAGILVILSYLIFTGESVSAARAVCMLVMAIIADVRARTYDMLTALSMASVMQIMDNPYIICNTSYIMSFFAMLGIALVLPVISSADKTLVFIKKKNRKNRTLKDEVIYLLCDSLSGCIAIQLMLLPALLYVSYETSFISVILNLIVIPLMPVVMISGIVSGLAGLVSIKCAWFMAGAAHYVLKLYDILCKACADIQAGTYVTGRPQVWQLVLYMFILAVWIAADSEYVKYCTIYRVSNLHDASRNVCNIYRNSCNISHNIKSVIIIVLLILAAVNMRYVHPKGLYIMMLDVGQGDCIYIHDENGISYLFDGGSTDVKQAGKYRIYKTLRYMGIRRIDYAVISHGDADHVNGIKELIDMSGASFTVGEVVMPDIKDKDSEESYAGMVEYAHKAGINISYKKAGDVLVCDNSTAFKITCMHPCESYDYEDANDYSAVYMIEYKDFSMLMMGDAGKKAEKCMMNDWKEHKELKVFALKAGHHGSRYSCSEAFLESIDPAIALISCGKDNRYKHPHKEMLTRLHNMDIKPYRTDEDGAIMINVSADKIKVQVYNDSR
ncbi:MAG TPA: DNA internalization-related competence protein ComEC/Rec2 [Eubacterium sp.]|nr:DNA internalization-related competence protein ComEC/Rec2 [Eubacterium sp.]